MPINSKLFCKISKFSAIISKAIFIFNKDSQCDWIKNTCFSFYIIYTIFIFKHIFYYTLHCIPFLIGTSLIVIVFIGSIIFYGYAKKEHLTLFQKLLILSCQVNYLRNKTENGTKKCVVFSHFQFIKLIFFLGSKMSIFCWIVFAFAFRNFFFGTANTG